ncbi:transposase [Pseudomonas sp. ICMP 561]|uniref:transposase n=1 Tax=Pseudomonas sp. ICMP 561 TaxID=1718918 RepID=UPI000C074987|nr:transposase [Pseudomonas sp. ICMP 561]PHN22819.1 transposase [Pseudomonas sp. ICMP 561]
MNKVIDTRFNDSLIVEKIRTKVTVKPEPVSALAHVDVMIAAEQFASTLKQVFIPNEFSLAFIRDMVGKAAVHNRQLFSSEAAYASKIFSPPDVEVSPVCLTGLAGVGKSQTIAALRKVLPTPVELSCELYEGTVTLVSHWYASARGKASGKALLEDFVFGDDKPVGRTTVAQLLQESRRRANRDGVCLALLEEMQHSNTGSGAAKVTDILLTMAAIGPPMVFVCNYSLGHKLFSRNSEDKQRLLSDPRIMLPDDPGSQDWQRYVAECLRVSNSIIKVELGELAAELYRCTFGIKRLAVLLLKLAYVECRDAGRQYLDISDITRAYRSAAYTVSAMEVEELQLLALGGRKKKTNRDLQCPFDLPVAMKTNVVNFARADRHERVIATVFDSAMTEKERAFTKDMEAPVAETSTAIKPRRRTPVTHLSVEEQGKAFREYMDKLAPSKPKKPK